MSVVDELTIISHWAMQRTGFFDSYRALHSDATTAVNFDSSEQISVDELQSMLYQSQHADGRDTGRWPESTRHYVTRREQLIRTRQFFSHFFV